MVTIFGASTSGSLAFLLHSSVVKSSNGGGDERRLRMTVLQSSFAPSVTMSIIISSWASDLGILLFTTSLTLSTKYRNASSEGDTGGKARVI